MTTVFYGREHLLPFDTTRAVRLCLLDGPLGLGWKHSSMTSDFIAEMVALRFRPVRRQYKLVSYDIGYVTNELIENAIKFRTHGEITVEVLADADSFKIRVSNFVDDEAATRFQQLLSDVMAGDPGDLLIQQLEASATQSGNASGLGLLTLMSDYQVHLAWRFEADGQHKRTKLETYASMAIGLS